MLVTRGGLSLRAALRRVQARLVLVVDGLLALVLGLLTVAGSADASRGLGAVARSVDTLCSTHCAGASGFLLKDSEPAELVRAVRVVAVTRTVIARFASTTGPVRLSHAGMAGLTDREREIVGWVAAGLSNDEIARRLVVSQATVRTHISRALAKTQARDRAQLVVFAYQAELPIPSP